MKKVLRNLKTKENKEFWDWCDHVSEKVEKWAPVMRSGTNVSLCRESLVEKENN